MSSDSEIAIEHQNVPVAHQGLHSFLYSSEDEHETSPVALEVELDEGLTIVPLVSWCGRPGSAKIAAVYAVLDRQQQTQYVGYSRDVRVSLQGHLAQNGEDACAFVRVQAFKFPKRAEMEELRDRWIADLGNIPPGNGNGDRWAGSIAEAANAVMSPEDRAAYEEKKLKLRKAMADSTLSQPEVETARQQDLRSAVQEDDWSAIVNSQTQETL